MKRTISLIIPLMAVICSCENQDPVREEMLRRSANLPVVTDVGYDDQSSTSTSLAIYWEAQKAIDAGAISFSIQLSEDEYFFEGEGSTLKTYERKVSEYPSDAILISSLTSGQEYYVRVASVYIGPNRTEWANLCDSLGRQAPVIPGKGIVEE